MLSFNRHLLSGIFSSSRNTFQTDERTFIFQVNLDLNTDTSKNIFILPLTPGDTYRLSVDWGDGSMSNITAWNDPRAVHYYKVYGKTFTIKIKGVLNSLKVLYNKKSYILVTQWGSSYNEYDNAWEGCSNVVFDTVDSLELQNITSLRHSWSNCLSLTSTPYQNTSNCTDFSYAWNNCINLSAIPALDLSNGKDFTGTWAGCSSLTEVPILDLSKCETLCRTWKNCSSIKTFSEPLNTFNVTSFEETWMGCTQLTDITFYVANNCTNFTNCFKGCYSLSSVNMQRIILSVDFTDCMLGRDSIINLFMSLQYTVPTQTITLTNNPGVIDLLPEDLQIATDRGWNVVL